MLEAHGYQVTVTELVGWEHSMKNELIRFSTNSIFRSCMAASSIDPTTGRPGNEDRRPTNEPQGP
jgi:hypothetical protein